MRVIVFLLLALALGKVGAQAYIQQQSTKNTIINAYREHALAACAQYNPAIAGLAAAGRAGFRVPATPAVSIELSIGKPDLDVRLWQTSHRNWSARYRDPFLIVKSSGANGPSVCEYDINRGTVFAATSRQRPNSG